MLAPLLATADADAEIADAAVTTSAIAGAARRSRWAGVREAVFPWRHARILPPRHGRGGSCADGVTVVEETPVMPFVAEA